MAKPRARSIASRQPAISGPLAVVFIALAIVVGAMMLDLPAGFWHQPALADLRAGILEGLGLATPQPTAVALTVGEPTAVPPTALPPNNSPSPANWYQIYFTNPRYPDHESDHHDGIDGYLVQLIKGAQRSIDVAAYELDLDTVADALLAAKARGVTVRLVTDSDNIDEKPLQRMKQGGIPVVGDNRGALMHNKFVIIDERYVWTGSWNLTVNCTYRNNNNALVIASEALARNYAAKFAEMFEKHHFGSRNRAPVIAPVLTIEGTRVENYFAPEDHVADHIAELLRGAKTSVRFLAYSFTDDRLGQILIERAKASVAVAGVIEKRGSDTEAAEYRRLRNAGIDVLLDGNPYIMHHKVFIVDDSIVVTGSFNFTENADKDNDENALIIYNADVARQYLEEFQRVRQRAASAEQS